jgi:hypothetical protein
LKSDLILLWFSTSEFAGQVNHFIRSNILMVNHGDAENVRKKVFVPGYADVCLPG